MADKVEMTVTQETLGHALFDRRLAVPIYQRSYAWKEDHVKELYTDFSRAIANEEDHFLGTVVIANDTEQDRPAIVDGQQRLATTCILLAAIRDRYLAMEDHEGAGIVENTYLISKELGDREPIPHLRLNEKDGIFFTNNVLVAQSDIRPREKGKIDSHKRIMAASKIAKQHVDNILSGIAERDHGNTLNKWVKFIREKTSVVWLIVPNYENAYIIFETLNDRGLELSIADLLKNYLFWKAEKKLPEVQTMWLEMTGTLEKITRDDVVVYYIHHLWSSYHGVTRKRELFKEVRRIVTNKQSVVDHMIKLRDNARLYAALREPNHEMWKEYGTPVKQALIDLHTLGVWQVRTLLLAVVGEWQPKVANKIIPLAVSWSIRFLMAGGTPSTLETVYAKNAKLVRDKTITTPKDLAQSVARDMPDDPKFESVVSTAKLTADHLVRYILRRLNESMGSTQGDIADETKYTIEHVYPREAKAAEWPNIDVEAGDEMLRRLGNLDLLPIVTNSTIGNKSFRDKKVEYAKGPLPLTLDLATYSEPWDMNKINERQKKLAKLAVKLWSLNLPK